MRLLVNFDASINKVARDLILGAFSLQVALFMIQAVSAVPVATIAAPALGLSQ